MKKFAKAAALAALASLGAFSTATAGEDIAQQIDHTLTFAIPRHAMQSFVDKLGPEFDYSIFVRPDCPTELQQMGLRKLWKTLPADKSESPFG